VQINNDDSSYNNLNNILHLKYFQNSVEVNYIAPYYFNAAKIQYRYLLSGINKTWINNNNNTSCNFTLVPPGSYAFHVAVSLNGTDWFESKDKFSFIISPPFWQTWWFYLLCAVAVAVLLYSIYRIRINKILAIQNVRNSISRELHDDVGSTLSSLHMVSALAKKKLKDDPRKTEELLEKITESSERMTGNMQDIVWAVNPLNDSFAQIIARMQKFAAQLCEAKNIELFFNADEKIKSLKLPLQYRTDLFMIFKEAVNNLAKYSNATKACIELHKTNNHFILEIKDDGVGFNTKNISHGNGLRNMHVRAENLHGKLTVLSGDEGTKVMLVFSA
ncbi:MAG TPA: histidine kinase, partial [Parafilimonas sp.]